ncbi:hypothetical protein J3B02_004012 [Coemansia erecta]|nr:hypothetical protein J3B02_004012 [Coemansia erecta]KAJ2879600.1 hypothetical protein FB639_003051 [Coemansia asiatica]
MIALKRKLLPVFSAVAASGLICTRSLSSTSIHHRISDRFKMQFRLPGRTTSVLSAGVVPTPNDPMIPRGKYFKPRGIPQGAAMTMMLAGRAPNVYEISTRAFRLLASPWAPDEYPRDYNGLRIRDYRVACLATKKKYSKKVYHRWRAARILRTAASLVLPDKGLKRCDYLFYAKADMRLMHRDELFLLVEQALVQMKYKIVAEQKLHKKPWYRPNPALKAQQEAASVSASLGGSSLLAKKKILEDTDDSQQPVPIDYCVSRIVQEMKDLETSSSQPQPQNSRTQELEQRSVAQKRRASEK